MSTLIPNLTYRVIRMPAAPAHQTARHETRYVGVAWNYDHGQLMSTAPHVSYQDARIELDRLVSERGCALRWFDGEYQVAGDGEQIVPVDRPTLTPEMEHELAHRA